MVEATKSDNVFVFFSDHGSVNLIAFPTKYLYADKMLERFKRFEKKYNKFVFYLEVTFLIDRPVSQAQCS